MGLKAKIKILRGEGIECENELKRMLESLGHTCEFWDLPRLFQNPQNYFSTLEKNDWIFLPGGFSFADHMGSGKLLAYELNEIKFFDNIFEKEANLWGICNGFQVLTASGVFGDVELAHNEFANAPSLFTDRWVKIHSPVLKEDYFYPARHGEGCLKITQLTPNTETFVKYIDWTNGSDNNTAGLFRKVGASIIIGLMPHGEIYSRPEQHPDYNFFSNTKDLNIGFDRVGIFKILENPYTERSL